MDLAITNHATTGSVVVALTGQLDVDSASAMHAAFDALRERSVDRIVVDLTRLQFCDSMGLSAFVVAHRRCAAAGGHLRLAGPGPFLLRVLSVVGIAEALPMYRTVAAACAGDPDGLIAVAAGRQLDP